MMTADMYMMRHNRLCISEKGISVPGKSDNAFQWEFAHPLSEDLS